MITTPYTDVKDIVYIAGHRGLAGSAITRELIRRGYRNLLLRTRDELDLRDAREVDVFFFENKPRFVVLAAAKVGGIQANHTYPATFIFDNLTIQNNVISAAHRTGVERLLFLGSSCIYPAHSPQPIREEYLLTGPLEPTNRPYAIAKIAGIEMCWSLNRQFGTRFVAAMPTNLYGPNDNYDLQNSHVLPALIRKVMEAQQDHDDFVTVWGSGTPLREFLHSDDLADACLFLLNLPNEVFNSLLSPATPPLINVGSGSEISVRELALLVCKVLGFEGEVRQDVSKPDGTSRKLMDSSKINQLGWRSEIGLEEGIRRVCTQASTSDQAPAQNRPVELLPGKVSLASCEIAMRKP